MYLYVYIYIIANMYAQEDAGSGPLHAVRLLEHTAVAAEQEKAVVEELRVVQAEQVYICFRVLLCVMRVYMNVAAEQEKAVVKK